MILLYVNAFKDTIKDPNSQPQELRSSTHLFESNNSRPTLLILRNILRQRNQLTAFDEALFFLKKARPNADPLRLLSDSLVYLKPLVAFRFKKVAGVRYRLPFIKTENSGRDQFQAARWLLLAATARRQSTGASFGFCICEEVLDISKRRGNAVNDRLTYHKLALQQRPFLKFL